MQGQSSYLQKKAENFAEWIGFYRQNPHRFMEDYFGTHLHPFQRFLFYMMNKDDKFMYIAARGQGRELPSLVEILNRNRNRKLEA